MVRLYAWIMKKSRSTEQQMNRAIATYCNITSVTMVCLSLFKSCPERLLDYHAYGGSGVRYNVKFRRFKPIRLNVIAAPRDSMIAIIRVSDWSPVHPSATDQCACILKPLTVGMCIAHPTILQTSQRPLSEPSHCQSHSSPHLYRPDIR